MERIITQMINELEAWKKKNSTLDERNKDDDPCLIEFSATPYAELGWNTAGKPEDGIYLNISPHEERGETYEDLYEAVYEQKFIFLGLMEDILTCDFSERTNSDACSFQYDFNYRTDGNNGLEFELKITDYLS